MEPSQFHFFEDSLAIVDSTMATSVNDVASNVITAITPVTTNLLILYVIGWGLMTLRGAISEPVLDGMNRVVRIAVIIGIALNVGRYNAFLADMLWQSPEILAGYITSGSGSTVTNTQYLDKLFSQIYDVGEAYWIKAQAPAGAIAMPDVGGLFIAGLIWIVGGLVAGYSFVLLLISKIALALILGVGPIFVLATLFQPTKRLFDLWLGQALSYVFLVMFTAGAIRAVLLLIQTFYSSAIASGVLINPFINQALPLIVICGFCFVVMLQIPNKAAFLGGGVAVNTMGAVNWTYDRMTGTASSLRPTSIRRTLNRARADAVITGRVGKAVVTSPVNLYRKITTPRKQRIANQ
jgi:type IV secretion system protein VirB6